MVLFHLHLSLVSSEELKIGYEGNLSVGFNTKSASLEETVFTTENGTLQVCFTQPINQVLNIVSFVLAHPINFDHFTSTTPSAQIISKKLCFTTLSANIIIG